MYGVKILMILLSVFGVFVLFIIQFLLYKKENSNVKAKRKLDFFKSKDLLEISKDFLVILLGVSIGITLNNIDVNNQDTKKVISLLEVSSNELNSAIRFNNFILEQYDNGEIDITNMIDNIRLNDSVLREVLGNDLVMTTISSSSYGFLLNYLHNLEALTYQNESINNIDEKGIRADIGLLNMAIQILRDALEKEIGHLQGNISKKDLDNSLSKLGNDFLTYAGWEGN